MTCIFAAEPFSMTYILFSLSSASSGVVTHGCKHACCSVDIDKLAERAGQMLVDPLARFIGINGFWTIPALQLQLRHSPSIFRKPEYSSRLERDVIRGVQNRTRFSNGAAGTQEGKHK